MHMHLYTCIFMCIYQNCSQRSNALYPQIGTHRPMEPTHMPIQAIILILCIKRNKPHPMNKIMACIGTCVGCVGLFVPIPSL